jgi:hypothetical protein
MDGQIITTESVVEKMREKQLEKELENTQKQNKRNRRLNFESLQWPVPSSQSQEPQSQSKQCVKCRKNFEVDTLLCENPACLKWLCNSCRPKRYKEGTSFYCCKKCRERTEVLPHF